MICCLCITLGKYFISFILPFQSGYKKHNILNIRVNLEAAIIVFISPPKGLQKSAKKRKTKKKSCDDCKSDAHSDRSPRLEMCWWVHNTFLRGIGLPGNSNEQQKFFILQYSSDSTLACKLLITILAVLWLWSFIYCNADR